ncbi:MAG: glutamate-1-semialdehyde-2,1-aminomutase [Chitinophagaceae bacterium]|nr:MAG: glutamate-1-semialdehyde-2,1-aminomutase [Chitinophagaceae bacterium]
MELSRTKSAELYEISKTFFPGGVNSPVRAFRSVGGTPLFIDKGEGAYIWDADGNKYLDFCCSWGPLISGHRNPAVESAIFKTMQNGFTFGAPTKAENELANLIITNHKYLDKIRFTSSGTEAVMSALRLARGYTGKDKIVKFEGCYHGHLDYLLVKAGSGLATSGVGTSAGIPKSAAEETLVLPLDDESAVEKVFRDFGDQIAAIIIEPIPANNGLLIQRKEYLEFLRSICDKYNALLIFDEVISGFRVGFEGASELYGIKPDILTFGKIVGGGLPVGAFGANNEIMSKIAPDGDVYQAGTLSGNPLAMRAGAAQLECCLKENFYSVLEAKTKVFTDKLNRGITESGLPVKVFQMASIFWISFSAQSHIRKASDIKPEGAQLFKLWHRNLLNKGLYLGPSGFEVGFVSMAHSRESLDSAADIMLEELKKLPF